METVALTIEQLRIEALIPYSRNTRTHTDQVLRSLPRSGSSAGRTHR